MVEPEAINWAFRLILGREVDDPALVADMAAHAESWMHVREAFFSSAEFRDNNGYRLRLPGRFEAKRSGRPTIVIISNCQGPEIARHLAASTEHTVIGLDVTHYTPTVCQQWLDCCDVAEAIVSVELSERYDGIRVEQLRARYGDRVRTMAPIEFHGLFPDILQLGPTDHPLIGPMILHSGIILNAFLRGDSIERCAESFGGSAFDAFGYHDTWDASLRAMRNREAATDLKLADTFIDRLHHQPLMLTHVHPTSIAYGLISAHIAEAFGWEWRDVQPAPAPAVALGGPIWPVYDPICQRRALRYRTPALFWLANEAMDLVTFIGRSYDAYRLIGAERLRAQLASCSEEEREQHRWIGAVLGQDEDTPQQHEDAGDPAPAASAPAPETVDRRQEAVVMSDVGPANDGVSIRRRGRFAWWP